MRTLPSRLPGTSKPASTSVHCCSSSNKELSYASLVFFFSFFLCWGCVCRAFNRFEIFVVSRVCFRATACGCSLWKQVLNTRRKPGAKAKPETTLKRRKIKRQFERGLQLLVDFAVVKSISQWSNRLLSRPEPSKEPSSLRTLHTKPCTPHPLLRFCACMVLAQKLRNDAMAYTYGTARITCSVQRSMRSPSLESNFLIWGADAILLLFFFTRNVFSCCPSAAPRRDNLCCEIKRKLRKSQHKLS